MTDKERLEEIKKKYFMYENYTGKVIMYHHVLEWLIEQAERVQELEGESSKYETRINNLTFDLAVSKAQNKRYREAIKDIKKTWKNPHNPYNQLDEIHEIIKELEESK